MYPRRASETQHLNGCDRVLENFVQLYSYALQPFADGENLLHLPALRRMHAVRNLDSVLVVSLALQ